MHAPTGPGVGAPASVVVSPSTVTIYEGQAAAASATVFDAHGAPVAGRAMTWTVGDTAVASVDGAGVVSGRREGTTTVTAAAGGVAGSAAVTVRAVPVASLTLTPPVLSLAVGGAELLAAVPRDSAGGALAGRAVAYATGDAAVATVDAGGLVTAVGVGATTITASAGGRQASAAVTVARTLPGRIVLGPSSGWVARGVPYALAATAYDAGGRAVADPSVTFASSDAAVATVSAAGVVQPLSSGTVTITAASADGKVGAAVLTVVERRSVDARVATADGGTSAELRFVARVGSGGAVQRFAAAVDGATGRATLDLPVLPAAAGTLELYVDAAEGSARRYHPSYTRLAAGVAPASVVALLVPEQVAPDSGTYAGRRVPVSVSLAFAAVCADASNANCQSYWPSYWIGGIKMWPDAARPSPLAFDRSGGQEITAADSVAFWAIVRQMETDLGRQLYQPSTFRAYTSPGLQSGAVLVTLDPTLAPNSGYTDWWWNALGDVFETRTRLGSAAALRLPDLVSHELLHAQGFSHSCQWSTVMGGYGCRMTTRLSESDVAYYHLAQLVRRRTAELRPTWGVAEALAGERVLELGVVAERAIPEALRARLARATAGGPDQVGHDGAH